MGLADGIVNVRILRLFELSDLEKMEQLILRAARKHTYISFQSRYGVFDKQRNQIDEFSPYFTPEKQAELQQLLVIFTHLAEQRLLYPILHQDTGHPIRGHTQGITLQGAQRLRQLSCPPCYWFRNNWFAALIGLGAIVSPIATALILANCVST